MFSFETSSMKASIENLFPLSLFAALLSRQAVLPDNMQFTRSPFVLFSLVLFFFTPNGTTGTRGTSMLNSNAIACLHEGLWG